MPGLLITAATGCTLQAGVGQLGTSGMQSQVTLTLPWREAVRDRGCPFAIHKMQQEVYGKMKDAEF